MKFQLYATMSAGFEQQAAANGGTAAGEIDEVKRMFLEYAPLYFSNRIMNFAGLSHFKNHSRTNPILLIVTAIVSVLHMVFEFLGTFTPLITYLDVHSSLFSTSFRCGRRPLEEEKRVHRCLREVCFSSITVYAWIN